ncbi:MAG: DUF933 domain-containing protein [Microbacteriaceae bacterium]|nr:DUF933 domain-containing protein [Microbacteriaceae bacterium]
MANIAEFKEILRIDTVILCRRESQEGKDYVMQDGDVVEFRFSS